MEVAIDTASATRVKKPKPRTAGVAATEHGRAQASIEQLQARVTDYSWRIAPLCSAQRLTVRKNPTKIGQSQCNEIGRSTIHNTCMK
jgi:hypothetical protein